ncbi:hypothetical protein C8R47DRAFT_1083573 [Mycena vitilis]|nr:hypothetical protein C8R47DRAFT_1083573 [Mycena vitilis]
MSQRHTLNSRQLHQLDDAPALTLESSGRGRQTNSPGVQGGDVVRRLKRSWVRDSIKKNRLRYVDEVEETHAGLRENKRSNPRMHSQHKSDDDDTPGLNSLPPGNSPVATDEHFLPPQKIRTIRFRISETHPVYTRILPSQSDAVLRSKIYGWGRVRVDGAGGKQKIRKDSMWCPSRLTRQGPAAHTMPACAGWESAVCIATHQIAAHLPPQLHPYPTSAKDYAFWVGCRRFPGLKRFWGQGSEAGSPVRASFRVSLQESLPNKELLTARSDKAAAAVFTRRPAIRNKSPVSRESFIGPHGHPRAELWRDKAKQKQASLACSAHQNSFPPAAFHVSIAHIIPTPLASRKSLLGGDSAPPVLRPLCVAVRAVSFPRRPPGAMSKMRSLTHASLTQSDACFKVRSGRVKIISPLLRWNVTAARAPFSLDASRRSPAISIHSLMDISPYRGDPDYRRHRHRSGRLFYAAPEAVPISARLDLANPLVICLPTSPKPLSNVLLFGEVEMQLVNVAAVFHPHLYMPILKYRATQMQEREAPRRFPLALSMQYGVWIAKVLGHHLSRLDSYGGYQADHPRGTGNSRRMRWYFAQLSHQMGNI